MFNVLAYAKSKAQPEKMTYYQNDTKASKIFFEINQDSGTPMEGIVSAAVTLQNPNDEEDTTTWGMDYIDIENNLVTFTLPNWGLTEEGTYNGQIKVYGTDEQRLTMTNFKYKVTAEIASGIEDTDPDIPILTGLINDTNEVMNRHETNYEEALALSAENANLEIVDARKGKTNLGLKIGEIDSFLEENKNELKPQYFNNNQPIITVVDDDATLNFLIKWVPVCEAKGIKISLGAVKDFAGTSGYMTLEQLKTLRDSGYDVLSHSKSHPHLYNISDADWELQCSESLQFVRENGFNDKAIVYPFGLYESGMDDTKRKNIKTLTRKYYEYGIDATETTNYLPVDSMRIERVGIGGADLASIKIAVDKCYSRKNWLVILTHCGYETNTNLYGDMIDYIKSLNIPILTFDEAIKRVGNVISTGDTLSSDYLFVSKDGKIKSSDIIKQQMVVVDNTLTNIDAPISTYKVGKITYCEITASADTYLNKGGHLQSYHSAVANQSYQELVVSEKFSNYSIRRRWLDSTTSWGEWQWVAGVIIGGRPTFNVKGCLCYDGGIQKLIINTGSNWRDTNGNIV
jgi:hypothetical protein